MVPARIAGLSPGTSPPPVRIPIRPFLVLMRALYRFLRACKRKSTEAIGCARGIAQTREYFALRILDTRQVFRLVAFFFRRRCNDLTFHLSRRSRARRRNESRQ